MTEATATDRTRFRLPRDRRIHGRSLFIELRRKGSRKRRSHLSVCYLPSTNPLRIGFAIPKKIGSAVIRNRIRRLLREYIRHHWYDAPDTGILLFSCHQAFTAMDVVIEREVTELIQQFKK